MSGFADLRPPSPESPAARLLSAVCGSILTSVLVTPLDVAKTRMQVGRQSAEVDWGSSTVTCSKCNYYIASNGITEHQLRKNGRFAAWLEQPIASQTLGQALRHIVRNEGFFALYAGLGPTFAMAVPANVLYFVAYETLRDELRKQHVPFEAFLAGSAARVVSVTLTIPFEVVRTRVQALDRNLGRTPRIEIADLVKNEGYRSFWKGLVPMLARDVPFSGLYWFLFEKIKAALKDAGLALASHPAALLSADVKLAFVSGAAAGSLAAFVTTPFDVIKTRQQVEAACSQPGCKPPGALTLVSDILRTEGPQRLFAGAVPRTLRVAPACAIMIGSYELTKHVLRNAREKAQL
jgi:solute carrier family 25 protein 39/40